MARMPDQEDGLRIDLSELERATVPPGLDPQVGDIYRPRAGQPGFWWIVSIVRGEFHHTCVYLIFNLRGELTGTSKAAFHYLREREKIGFMPMPDLVPQWL